MGQGLVRERRLKLRREKEREKTHIKVRYEKQEITSKDNDNRKQTAQKKKISEVLQKFPVVLLQFF